MIVVERGALLEPQIVAIAIIPVVIEHGDLVVADALDDAADDRGFARARAAGDADDERSRARRQRCSSLATLATCSITRRRLPLQILPICSSV